MHVYTAFVLFFHIIYGILYFMFYMQNNKIYKLFKILSCAIQEQ